MNHEKLVKLINSMINDESDHDNAESIAKLRKMADRVYDFCEVYDWKETRTFKQCSNDYVYFMDNFVFDCGLRIQDLSSMTFMNALFQSNYTTRIDINDSFKNYLVMSYIFWKMLFHNESTYVLCLNKNHSSVLFEDLCRMADRINERLFAHYDLSININIQKRSIEFFDSSCILDIPDSFERRITGSDRFINNMILFDSKFFKEHSDSLDRIQRISPNVRYIANRNKN